MKLTNRLNLPASIVAAVANDPYKGGGDISVTKLITPPYQRKLMLGAGEQLVEDVSDRIWSLMGQIGHSIVERMTIDPATSVAEERLYTSVMVSQPVIRSMKEVIVSGQFDLIENQTLMDFKFTSVYSRDGKAEWEQQLNMLRLLCHLKYMETGDKRYDIKAIQIVAVFRDWTKMKVGIGDYPETQVMVIPVKLWTLDEAEAFMRKRVELHMSDDPAPCTDEERWATEEVWALMKKGRKSAVKLYRDEVAAHDAAILKGKDHTVVHRQMEYKRCASYCSAAGRCSVWKAVLKDAPF